MRLPIMLLAVMLVSFQLSGQKKSDADKKDAPTDSLKVQIDSLTKAVKGLTLQLDSVSGELIKYTGLYNTIRDKVIHYAFDPTRAAYLIDSLKASRDSVSSKLFAIPKSTTASDSLFLLLKESSLLKTRIDSIKVAWDKERSAVNPREIEKAKAFSDLKQLKELLDNKIITDSEYLIIKKKYLEKL